MKGVLAVANEPEKFVYQGVHMVLNAEFAGEVWGPGEVRESKLVFIGKNLDKEALKEGFSACVMTPALLERKRGMLRFSIGEKVECITPDGWQSGEVVGQMYRDEKMPIWVFAPYQVRVVESGRLVCLLKDSDDVIRKQSWFRPPQMFKRILPQRRNFSSMKAAYGAPLRHGAAFAPERLQRPPLNSVSALARSLRRLK
jgi:hypothetical protein